TYRDWLDKSELKDGDTIVVSIYAKTAEEGKKTFFNMGLIENSKTFGYNALTAEYGTTGMEIDSSWKKFAGTITIPNGFEQGGMADEVNYTLHLGYPAPCANPAKIHVSTVYAAKVAVAEMQNRFEDGEAVLEKGQSKKLLTKTLNQIGTTAGLSQDFTYYVTNQDRTEILTDSGITVTPGAGGEATVAAADTTADGIYYVVAVAPTGEVMGQRVLVGNTGSDLTEVTVYVSPDGDDGNPGTLEKPLKTLNQAKAMVQSLRGEKDIPVTVYLRGGEYALTGTFTLNEEDGGTEEAPVVYRAYEDEKVVLSGSTPYDFSKFQKVSGKMKELLPERAQEHVVVASGAELGLKPIEISVQDSGFEIEAPMMMLDGNAMNLARYPNSGIAEDWIFGEAVSPNSEKNSIPVLKLEDDTFWSWSYRPDDYVYFSYLAYGWTAGAFLGTRNADEQTVTGTTTSYYGTSSGNKKATRVFNAYEAIDEPGEWYYDKGEDKLYVYPFEDTGTDSKLYVTEGTFDLVSLKNTDYVSFEGITFTSSRGVGVSMNGTDHCVINNCNLINFRNRAAKIENATYCGIQNSQVSYCGTSMLYISGGDTETLTSGHNFVVNNVIHDGTKLREFNVPGVTVRGVGTRIANNEFYNFAQQTINFASAGDSATSVDTLIEYNSFHECNTNAVDLAVIYGGRDMRCHGTTIQYNHFYNISSGYNEYRFSGSAVFGDDGISDFTVTHNIVGPGCSGDNTEAFKINWGHGNVITDNLVIDLPTMFYMYNFKNFVERVNEQAANAATAPGETGATLTQVWANPLYQERWPWIKAFYEGNGYYVPNEIARNILIYTDNVPHSVSGWAAFNNSWYVHNNGKVGSDEPEINGFTTNLVILKSADRDNRDLFYDYANGDYRLKEEVLQQVPGFSNIDQSEIGLSTFSYDGQELLPGGEKPTVSNVGLSALPKVGKELQATYTYADADGDAEG
ncbi:MAG: right-handed parallel beta-helix repeat-containing protein, partial [Clostridia bacterium]|nr:right-handed parallel beta-helix repeat-containing protein [Clostridia bacterium]